MKNALSVRPYRKNCADGRVEVNVHFGSPSPTSNASWASPAKRRAKHRGVELSTPEFQRGRTAQGGVSPGEVPVLRLRTPHPEASCTSSLMRASRQLAKRRPGPWAAREPAPRTPKAGRQRHVCRQARQPIIAVSAYYRRNHAFTCSTRWRQWLTRLRDRCDTALQLDADIRGGRCAASGGRFNGTNNGFSSGASCHRRWAYRGRCLPASYAAMQARVDPRSRRRAPCRPATVTARAMTRCSRRRLSVSS